SSDPDLDGGGKRRRPARDRGRPGRARPCARPARRRRARRPGAPLSRPALGRRAAARRARPRGRARSRATPGRRADRQPRLRHRRADHRAPAGAEPEARIHPRAGDARRGARGPRRPRRATARRPDPQRRLVSLAFALRMAWRETRGASRHFAVFFGCVALGVTALVSVGTFAANLDRTMAREARALTGGDLELRSAQPLDQAARAALAELARAGAATTT